MTIHVTDIIRYPVKGLPGVLLPKTVMKVRRPLDHDRQFALVHANSEFDESRPRWEHRKNFVVVAHSPRLAATRWSFDNHKTFLEIPGHGSLEIDLQDVQQRQRLADALEAFLGDSQKGPYRVVESPDHALADSPVQGVSVMNKATLREIEQTFGAEIDFRRFRGNLWIDGAAPWEEFDWVGERFQLGDSHVEFIQRIERCAATSANPATGERDLRLPTLLKHHYEHIEFGVLATVSRAGEVSPGDRLVRLGKASDTGA